MFVHVALHEDRGDIGVETGGQQYLGRLKCLSSQHGGVSRHGEGVKIDNAVEAIDALFVDPVPKCPEIVAELHFARGLDTREDARHQEILGAEAGRRSPILQLDVLREIRAGR